MSREYSSPTGRPEQSPVARAVADPPSGFRALADALERRDYAAAKGLLPALRAAGWSVVPIAGRGPRPGGGR